MSSKPISKKQKEILEYIRAEILKNGFPPSVRDICAAVALKSTSSVHSHLEILERNGYIHRDPAKSRTIEIIDEDFALIRRDLVNVPMLSSEITQETLLSRENIKGYFPMPAEYLPENRSFMTTAEGDGMINAGILDGDQVLVSAGSIPANGDMTAALLENKIMIGTYKKEKGRILLRPENDHMEPVVIDPAADESFRILGTVFGVIRLHPEKGRQ